MSAHDAEELPLVRHWIDGERWVGEVGRSMPVTNPATGRAEHLVQLASAADVDDAVFAATQAFGAWRETSLARRAEILFRFRELLSTRRGELAQIITAEHGKVLDDALGEIARGLEVVEFACGCGQLMRGGMTENASTGVDVYSIRQPLGPVAIIAPFNFPAMVPLWFFPIAIATGNTVLLKPSEKVPSAAVWLAELWREAGLPPGVFNVVHGDGAVSEQLIDHPGVKAISFVGSTPVARTVFERATGRGKRVQALGGAKNHLVVLDDADLDEAAVAAVNAAFGSAGERCMAISVLVAVESIADDLVARIAAQAGRLRIGDGRGDVDLGPLISRDHRDRVADYVRGGAEAGATLVLDGRGVEVDGRGDGFWLGPSLLDHVTTEMQAYRDEIFGPVLSVVRVPSYDEAIRLVNASPFGNGTAIFTNDGAAARRFQHEIEVGMVGINVPIPVPVPYYSFGGWKDSLFGDSHAYGEDGVRFFTRGKVITARWRQNTRTAVDLGFPANT
ncbi:MAG TPA: CoA-acylating methylmalonate-semialdehyde dehydrogenase [Candidatus Ruania gallistercoris]|uniref:methylmalonate-semialdehyde dehydrogenase (CoA acylating) n=1 Tax=Candidatus Ruania gallistercoris TaxID=2838746 RepID=A0A9D2J5E4_9MICO|nr:CoA-acylating methylmalonate-semialdehyde dehydrogenase [Candidatus Ruania gallistercoris]